MPKENSSEQSNVNIGTLVQKHWGKAVNVVAYAIPPILGAVADNAVDSGYITIREYDFGPATIFGGIVSWSAYVLKEPVKKLWRYVDKEIKLETELENSGIDPKEVKRNETRINRYMIENFGLPDSNSHIGYGFFEVGHFVLDSIKAVRAHNAGKGITKEAKSYGSRVVGGEDIISIMRNAPVVRDVFGTKKSPHYTSQPMS